MDKKIRLPREGFIDDKDAEGLVSLPTDDDGGPYSSMVVSGTGTDAAAWPDYLRPTEGSGLGRFVTTAEGMPQRLNNWKTSVFL